VEKPRCSKRRKAAIYFSKLCLRCTVTETQTCRCQLQFRANWRTPRTSSAKLVLPRACSTASFASNRSQHDPFVCGPAAKIKQWLAFARCPICVAQHPQCSVADVSPAGGAAHRTPDGRGSWQKWHHSQRPVSLRANAEGTSLAQPPHCKSASVRRLVSQMPKGPAYGHQARDAAQPSP
jgi:hypothetical protein